MGLLDIFKKKKESTYDVTNLTVLDLDEGFIFDYNLSSWEVQEVYEYDWGDNIFTKEYKVSDGEKTLFLNVENDDELEISLSEKVNVRKIGANIVDYIQANEKPPKELSFESETYYFDEESPGYIRHMNEPENWIELMSWDYYNNDETKTICIEQFDDNKFDASYGKIIKEFEISNILPAQKK